MLLQQGVSDFCGRLDELLAGSKDPQRGFDVSIRAFTLYSPGNRVICGILRGFGLALRVQLGDIGCWR